MFARCVLACLIVAGGGLSARAVDLSGIPRGILKEPAYQGKPRYCLLVFGKKADTRIWLVRDDKDLYVDHNGNGDLTEPGEKYAGTSVVIRKLVERDGTEHRNLHVYSQNDGTFTMEVGIGARRQYVGIDRMERPTWGDRPENAPIIHFNGPMSLERYGPIYKLPRMTSPSNSIRFSLRVMLGTPGLGKGTFASYDETCSQKLGPLQAEIVYSPPSNTSPVIKQSIQLMHEG